LGFDETAFRGLSVGPDVEGSICVAPFKGEGGHVGAVPPSARDRTKVSYPPDQVIPNGKVRPIADVLAMD